MHGMKTVLAPGVPWPKYESPPEQLKKKKRKSRAKPSKVDKNFERWLASERSK
jgi:hypothetical protein